MSDELFPPEMPPGIQEFELHEKFVQYMERGSGRLKVLSIITLGVAVLLLASYFSQILYPFVTGETTVTVNLVDPSLLILEGLIVLLTLGWLYVGAANYLFASRLSKRIKRARAMEADLLKRIEG